MNPHQMDVRILFALELFATHVAGSVHVELHVGVKLVLLGKSFLTSFLGTLEVSAVLSGQMPPIKNYDS